MSHSWKSIIACLGLFVLAIAVGCGQSGDSGKTPAAAVNGSGGTAPAVGGATTSAAPQSNIDKQHPVVVIETSLGNITVQLNREKAPLTVENFLYYVTNKFYDQTIVHQVFKDQGVLAGGYDTGMHLKAGRTAIFNEAANGLKNRRYTIAMTRLPDSIHSATSQFFINVVDNPDLDYKDHTTAEGYGYCVFGMVTDGMDVVDKINNVSLRDTPTIDRTPSEQIVVKSIRWIR